MKIEKKALIWNHQSLTTMADILGLSRGGVIGCGHKYTEYYEYLFNKWNNKPVSILETGLHRYGTDSIPSIELWKAYFGKYVSVYGYDSNPAFQKFNNPSENIKIFTGKQQDSIDTKQCCKTTYDIIIDDGEHDSEGQQVMMKTVWNSLNPGGLYCIESLHWQPRNDIGMKTKNLLTNWQIGNIVGSEFISLIDAIRMYNTIDSIEFYSSKSSKWDPSLVKYALCVIRKK
jgi:hypothetical protein